MLDNNEEVVVEETQDPEAQKIIDRIQNGEEEFNEADNDIDLPSDGDNTDDDDDSNNDDETLFAGKYKTVDDLKKGIKNLGTDLPEYVLDGMSDEALEKYYTDKNKDFQKNQSNKDRKHSIDNKEENDKSDDDKPNKVPQELWTELSNKFVESGGITDEHYDKLEALGIPNNIVDDYLDGLKAKQVAFTNEVYNIAGGEKEYNTIKTWAESNLDEAYIDSISRMGQTEMLGALRGIKAQYDLANGGTKRMVGSTNRSKGSGYKNQDEYLRDVSDKRYTTDEHYRKAVDRKLENSKF